jgi:hypothetical protein
MNLRKVVHWTGVGAATAVLLNSVAAFGTDVSPDRALLDPGIVRVPLAPAAGYIVGRSSIHDAVIEDLQRDPTIADSLRDAGKDNPPAGGAPTSMLWPAYKYIPQLSNAVTT